MKKAISIVLLLILVFQIFSQLYYLGYYQLNKGFIAEFLCINQDKPEMQCQGKCFLTEKLEEAGQTAHGEEKPLIEQDLRLLFIFQTHSFLEIAFTAAPKDQNPVLQHLHSKERFSRLLKPPRLV